MLLVATVTLSFNRIRYQKREFSLEILSFDYVVTTKQDGFFMSEIFEWRNGKKIVNKKNNFLKLK